MKHLIASFLFLFVSGSSVSADTPVFGLLDQYDLGSWAYRMHNEICARIHPAIAADRFSQMQSEGRAISRESALQFFEEEVTSFISTSSDDPTQGYDTTYRMPRTWDFHSFQFSGKHTIIRVSERSKEFRVLSAELNKLLNQEQLLYLRWFRNGEMLRLEEIPLRSLLLMQDINIRLHLEGKKPKTRLYTDAGLQHTFDAKEKESRGGFLVPVFISTQAGHPEIGYDSVYAIPLLQQLKDSSQYQAVWFAMHPDEDELELEAFSASYSVSGPFLSISLCEAYGYIPCEDIKSLNEEEKHLLEHCLMQRLHDRMLSFGGYLPDYLQKFALESKRPGSATN